MKLCKTCGQLVAEEVGACPSCGGDVAQGRKTIDDYRILDVLHEGYSSVLCKAIQNGSDQPVMIRIFTPQSGVDDAIAQRLQEELEKLKKLPEEYFVRHLEIKKSADGLWYRVSEWIEAENWGTLLASGRLKDVDTVIDLFYRIASILEGLHQIGHIIPHLILDDIIVYNDASGQLAIKIDFKVSRFLDPAMKRPGEMLRQFLVCHPDIVNQRPLDFRSDIWSLGKIFVEILTADYDAPNYKLIIKRLPLPEEVKLLLKIMLADDPDLRPKSMSDISRVLRATRNSNAAARLGRKRSGATTREIKGIKKWIVLLIVVMIVLFLAASAWFYFVLRKGDVESVFEEFTNRYAASVAFVVTEYWLIEESRNQTVYHNWTEGTAFLVDPKGYLMTNRHVACPWLEDGAMNAMIADFKRLNLGVNLKYRIFLWFEGARAFKRLPVLSDTPNLADVYILESAYRTDGEPRLSIAGVASLPVKTWQVVKFPLRDDFAILKIDEVPDRLKPLPLDTHAKTSDIRRLSPVISLGFPLGSETQESSVNVSVTRGHVRRIFENLFQVDASIYQGNSGGPIIDRQGNVIGIVSRVAIEMAEAPLPVATRLSDIGMVLPIHKAATFMKEIQSGAEKWNGVMDLGIDRKIQHLMQLAKDRKWAEAESAVLKELSLSRDPALISAAGMISFCLEKYAEAIVYFKRALSMDQQNHFPRFMIYLGERRSGASVNVDDREALVGLDWRSPFEFYAYLVKILERMVDNRSAYDRWYSPTEKSWLQYLKGTGSLAKEEWVQAEESLKQAVLAAPPDNWIYCLALAELDRVLRLRSERLLAAEEQNGHPDEREAFDRLLEKKDAELGAKMEKMSPLIADLVQNSTGISGKSDILERLYRLDPMNREILVWLAYYCAMGEAWQKALVYSREFLQINGRESSGRLSLGVLESGILKFLGMKEQSTASLEAFAAVTRDSWYRTLIACLLGGIEQQVVAEKAGGSPEYLLTAHAALGFWAEGSGESEKASKHYEDALSSYLDDKVEYEFAAARLKRIKTVPSGID